SFSSACCAAAGSPSSASGAAIPGIPAASTPCRPRRSSAATLMRNSFFPNNPRLYLWVALGMLVFLNVEYWMRDYGPRPGETQAPVAGAPAPATPVNELGNRVPQGAQSSAAAGDTAPVVHVHTDVMD